MGARLTGGGFGGSVVVLVHPRCRDRRRALSSPTRAISKPATLRVRPALARQLVKEAV